jgi:hypothetical protein
VAGFVLVERRKGGNVTEERIRARRIELVDDEGNVRMISAVEKGEKAVHAWISTTRTASGACPWV